MCLVVMLSGALAGCSDQAPEPVSTVAAEPYVCDGVPSDGVRSLLGGEVEVEPEGAWGADGIGFGCTIRPADGDGPTLMVIERGPGLFVGRGQDEQEELEQLMAQGDADPIEADVTGGGVVAGGRTDISAVWVCGERELSVELLRHPDAHDRREDVERLLISMLPWACGGADVPLATEG